MPRSFVASYAISHFAERPRQPLLAGIASRIGAANLIDALTSECQPVQHIALRRLVDLPESKRDSLLLDGLKSISSDNPESVVSILQALTHDAIPLSDEIGSHVITLMTSTWPAVRTMAARVLALRQPTAALPLLNQGIGTHRDVLRELCLTDNPDLIVPLMVAFGFPDKSPPPTIGFAVTPQWLSDHHSQHPDAVTWLIRNCGYYDGEVGHVCLNLLSEGFSFMTTAMINEPRVLKIAHLWLRRIRAFVWRLLPTELDLLPDDNRPFNATNDLDTALFLAAVRDSDRTAFGEQKWLPPFSHEAMKREITPVCFHASSRYGRRLFLDQPLEWCDRWKVPEDRKGEFLIDHARVLLEANENARLAADRAFRGKWLTVTNRRSTLKVVKRRTTDRPPRELIIGNIVPPPPNAALSVGANSIVALAAAGGIDPVVITTWLQDAEERWSRCLLPIGAELQIPQVDPDRFAAWKDALPYLGVPSPIRPEFGGMLEAAFRPARSFHAMALAPLLLCQLGAITAPQDMALHLSLQDDFDDALRYIAFPYFFIHPSARLSNRPSWSMARVLSKGFVHVHDDAEVVTPANTSSRRTEMRLFRVFAESVDSNSSNIAAQPAEPSDGIDQSKISSVALRRGYASDIVCVEILCSILASDCPECQRLFQGYVGDIQQAAQQQPAEIQELLAANYYESTGDPRDETLLSQLPVFRSWSKVRQVVRSLELSHLLDILFRKLRTRHIGQILNHWTTQHGLVAPEIKLIDGEIELILPDVMNSSPI